jgi:hypothetical protein
VRAMKRSQAWFRQTVRTLVASTLLAAVVAPVATAAGVASPVGGFLVKPGEMQKFEPGKIQIFRQLSAVRDAAGNRPSEPELRRYEEEGYVEAAVVRLHDGAEPAAKGISSVFEFETVGGAKAEMRSELKEELDPRALRQEGILTYLTLRHFEVPSVPNAVAFAFVSNKAADEAGLETGVAKGLFVEGSCLFAVSVFRPTSNEVIEPVISGVQAIAARMAGICP